MTNYNIEFEYKITEFGNTTLEADNPDQADDFAREYIYETYPDVTNIEIVSVKEVKNG